VDKSYCFSSFLLGLIFNILLSLGHLKTFSGHELPLHFSITPRSAITRHDNLGGGGGGWGGGGGGGGGVACS
jgi:uncharacterized membrane protein